MTSRQANRGIIFVSCVLSFILLSVGAFLYIKFFGFVWSTAKDIVSTVNDGATIVALILGGIWTYFNFIKGKIYQPRLEPGISGRIIRRGGIDYLVVIAQLKNIGITEVNLAKGCAITVFSYQLAAGTPAEVNDAIIKELAVLPVFVEETSVVFGATMEDQRLLELPPSGHLAFRIQLRVVYNDKESNTGTVIEYPTAIENRELTIHVKGLEQP